MGDFLIKVCFVFVHPLFEDRREQSLSSEVASRASRDVAQDVFEQRLLFFILFFRERAFVSR